MLGAATAWSELAAELSATAASYQSVITGLTGESWRGPASVAAAASAAPYVAWLQTTAAQAEQSAGQAAAAAAAHESAFAATVPPPVISANRALLASLVATNILGQNTPAIAANEAHYAEMWAQDAAAMYSYAGASAAASNVTPFTSPRHNTNPAGPAGQAAAVGQSAATAAGSQTQSTLSQLVATLPNTLQELAAPLSSSSPSGLSGVLENIVGSGAVSDSVNGMVNAGFWNGTSTISTAMGFLSSFGSTLASGGGGNAATGALGAAVTSGIGSGALGSAGGLSSLGGLGGGVSAGLGQAGAAGALSVPASWAAPASAVTPTAALTSTGSGAVPGNGMAAVPAGMPMTGMHGRADVAGPPRYGFRPTVIVHPPAAG